MNFSFLTISLYCCFPKSGIQLWSFKPHLPCFIVSKNFQEVVQGHYGLYFPHFFCFLGIKVECFPLSKHFQMLPCLFLFIFIVIYNRRDSLLWASFCIWNQFSHCLLDIFTWMFQRHFKYHMSERKLAFRFWIGSIYKNQLLRDTLTALSSWASWNCSVALNLDTTLSPPVTF